MPLPIAPKRKKKSTKNGTPLNSSREKKNVHFANDDDSSMKDKKPAAKPKAAAVAHDKNNNDDLKKKPAAKPLDKSLNDGNSAVVKAKLPATPASSTTCHRPSLAGSVLEAIDLLGNKHIIRIQNISSTADLGVKLDLKKIALKCRNTEYNPRKFGAVIMRIHEPKATALIFHTGKMCITGVKTVHNATLAATKFAYIIERIGFKPQELVEFKVTNLAATVDVGFPIRLEGLVRIHRQFASYEPELFPGLIYRLAKPVVVFLIFVSGKIVMTGAKKETDLRDAFLKMYPALIDFKKEHIATVLPELPPAAPMEATVEIEKASKAVESSSDHYPTKNTPEPLPAAAAAEYINNAGSDYLYETHDNVDDDAVERIEEV